MARLKTGEDVIGDFIQLVNDQYEILEPMMVDIEHGSKQSGLMMSHWLPVQLIQDNKIKIHESEILGWMQPSEEFTEYYINSVLKIKELMLAKKKINEIEEEEYDEVMEAFEELSNGNIDIH